MATHAHSYNAAVSAAWRERPAAAGPAPAALQATVEGQTTAREPQLPPPAACDRLADNVASHFRRCNVPDGEVATYRKHLGARCATMSDECRRLTEAHVSCLKATPEVCYQQRPDMLFETPAKGCERIAARVRACYNPSVPASPLPERAPKRAADTAPEVGASNADSAERACDGFSAEYLAYLKGCRKTINPDALKRIHDTCPKMPPSCRNALGAAGACLHSLAKTGTCPTSERPEHGERCFDDFEAARKCMDAAFSQVVADGVEVAKQMRRPIGAVPCFPNGATASALRPEDCCSAAVVTTSEGDGHVTRCFDPQIDQGTANKIQRAILAQKMNELRGEGAPAGAADAPVAQALGVGSEGVGLQVGRMLERIDQRDQRTEDRFNRIVEFFNGQRDGSRRSLQQSLHEEQQRRVDAERRLRQEREAHLDETKAALERVLHAKQRPPSGGVRVSSSSGGDGFPAEMACFPVNGDALPRGDPADARTEPTPSVGAGGGQTPPASSVSVELTMGDRRCAVSGDGEFLCTLGADSGGDRFHVHRSGADEVTLQHAASGKYCALRPQDGHLACDRAHGALFRLHDDGAEEGRDGRLFLAAAQPGKDGGSDRYCRRDDDDGDDGVVTCSASSRLFASPFGYSLRPSPHA